MQAYSYAQMGMSGIQTLEGIMTGNADMALHGMFNLASSFAMAGIAEGMGEGLWGALGSAGTSGLMAMGGAEGGKEGEAFLTAFGMSMLSYGASALANATPSTPQKQAEQVAQTQDTLMVDQSDSATRIEYNQSENTITMYDDSGNIISTAKAKYGTQEKGVYEVEHVISGGSKTNPITSAKSSTGAAYGTGYIGLRTTDGVSMSKDIHGGGSKLANPWAEKQGWHTTEGCARMQNQSINTFLTVPTFLVKIA